MGTHWKPLNTSNPNQAQQGRLGGDNGRGVKVVSGGGRKGGDSVKWVGKALRVADWGTQWSEDEGGDWGSVGEALRAVWVGTVWVMGSVGGWRCSQLWAARWWEQWQRSEGGERCRQ